LAIFVLLSRANGTDIQDDRFEVVERLSGSLSKRPDVAVVKRAFLDEP
jgi:hypothetical protein